MTTPNDAYLMAGNLRYAANMVEGAFGVGSDPYADPEECFSRLAWVQQTITAMSETLALELKRRRHEIEAANQPDLFGDAPCICGAVDHENGMCLR